MSLLSRVVAACLTGIIVYAILLIIAAILGMVGVGQIGAIVERFAWIIAVLVGLAAFLGYIPNYWSQWIK